MRDACLSNAGVCGAECRLDTGLTITGTSFGPVLCGIIRSYHNAHVAENDMQTLLADLEKMHASVGAISKYVTAIADHLNARPYACRMRGPIVMDDTTLREHRLPIRPRAVPPNMICKRLL